MSSEKYKKLKHVCETSNSTIRDLLIRCKVKTILFHDKIKNFKNKIFVSFKNFMTKRFVLKEHDYENVLTMVRYLYSYTSTQRVIPNRFSYMINKLNTNKNQTNTTEIFKNIDSKRISYMIPSDLQQDLIECKCDSYMQVNSGYAEIGSNKFIIHT